MDSNPLVAGKGVQILRDHGIYVETGILDAECRKLNEVFYHYIATKTPFVVMKYAMTLDGKIACAPETLNGLPGKLPERRYIGCGDVTVASW